MTTLGFDENVSSLAKAVKATSKFVKDSRSARMDMQAIFGHMLRRNKKRKDDGQEETTI